MAHELEIFGDGTASFVSAREHAWHRLGVTLPDSFDALTAMEYARLGGWNVRKEPLTATVITAEGVTTVRIPDHYASIRDSPETGLPEALGVVGETYEHIQNEDNAETLDAITGESGAHFETAGSLKGGRQVFLTMKLPQTMLIGGRDRVDLYLCALNSHNGSTANRYIVTPVRVVCANTQTAAISGAVSSFSIRHTSGSKARIAEARRALGLTFKFAEKFQAEADRMIEAELTRSEFAAIVAQLWPVAEGASARSKTNAGNRARELSALFNDADTNAAIRGTRWAGYQAVTEWADHFAPAGRGSRDATTARAARVVAGGPVAEVKARAFALLTV